MRFDRTASIYFFMPIIQLLKNNSITIPILMYHGICTDPEKFRHPYFYVNTSPEIFEKQMNFLYEHKYKSISLSTAVNLMNSNQLNDEKYVVITFDDGYRDFYTEAYPILTKYRFTATVFITTGYIGKLFKDKSCMTWDDIKFLHKNNVDFGSHTIHHPELYTLDFNQIEFELKESKNTIEANLGSNITSFSYPFAFPQQDKSFVEKLNEILLKCDYKIGVTTKIGISSRNDSPLFLKRIPINSSDDTTFFNAKLNGAYNWLNNFQSFYKRLKNIW
jgi:peptidoglycan/xylan/chitin deacetylase (PgdA/CDA1 family)